MRLFILGTVFGAAVCLSTYVLRSPGSDGARTPYETCIRAANTPGQAGFAGEVCEPLGPGLVE